MPKPQGARTRAERVVVQQRFNWNQVSRDAVDKIKPIALKSTVAAAIMQLFLALTDGPDVGSRVALHALALAACVAYRVYGSEEAWRKVLAACAFVSLCGAMSVTFAVPILGGAFAYAAEPPLARGIAFVIGVAGTGIMLVGHVRPELKAQLPDRAKGGKK